MILVRNFFVLCPSPVFLEKSFLPTLSAEVSLGFCWDLFILILFPSPSPFSTNGKRSCWGWQLPNRGWEMKKSACGTLRPMSVRIWFSSWREQRNRLSSASVQSRGGGGVCTAGHNTGKSRQCPVSPRVWGAWDVVRGGRRMQFEGIYSLRSLLSSQASSSVFGF